MLKTKTKSVCSFFAFPSKIVRQGQLEEITQFSSRDLLILQTYAMLVTGCYRSVGT